jgi:uncharacterized protein with PIN domain
MKFITDGMLGKLTRWLRMLGHNVKYFDRLTDKQIIIVAKKERRVLLTRDLELHQQAMARSVKSLYLNGKNEEKLAKLAKKLKIKLKIDMKTSRCPKCNTRIRPIPKDTVLQKVEHNTFLNYNEYWICPKCKQIYWQGAHWEKIAATLEKAREKLVA